MDTLIIFWLGLTIGVVMGMSLNAIFSANSVDDSDELELPKKL